MILPTSIIFRDSYLQKVLPFKGKGLIKLFSGQHRVGKSYLLFQLISIFKQENSGSNIIYINKEDLQFDFIKTGKDLFDYIKSVKKDDELNFVFIDEIQDIKDFGQGIMALHLDQDLDMYCTGSNADMLSGDISGHLSGRYIEIKVYSLSYLEFLNFHNLEDSDAVLKKYLKYGGFPFLKHLVLEDEIVFGYLKNIYCTILYMDIIKRYAIRNTVFLEQLVRFLARNSGSIFSAKKISDFLKSQEINIAHNQVQTYVNYLANAFLIHKVPRYDIVGKRVLETGDKYYFENLGIRHGIWGYRPEDLGKILENAVYNHLIFLGYSVKVGVIGSEEIDFVCEKEGETAYFQVALSLKETKTNEREFGNLKKIQDNYPKTVITMDPFEGNTSEGIRHMDLRSFLKEEK